MEKLLLVIFAIIIGVAIFSAIIKGVVLGLKKYFDITGNFLVATAILIGVVLIGASLLYPEQTKEKINALFDENQQADPYYIRYN